MKYVSSLAIALTLLYVSLMSTGASAAVPLTVTHQGRLLDVADQPVNGVFDITYRIFEVPSGGSPVWTEVHASVQVTDGLFSALLGSTVPLSPDVLGNGGGGGGGGALSPRYLEVSVGGTALSPRLALSSVPSALSSSHVTGDIETSPGRVAVGDLDGDGFLDFSSTADQSELHIARKRPGRIKYSNINLRVMPDSLSDYRDTDSDDDGVPESEFSQRLTPTTSSVAIKTKGTGADANKTAALAAVASSGSYSSLACTIDDDGDGVPETSVSSSCDVSSASQVMEKKGLNAVNVKLARTISSPPSGPLAQDYLDVDSDDDGVMDKSVSSSCDATGARLKVNNIGSSGQDGVELMSLPASSSMAIKTKGTGADKNRITSKTNPEVATTLLEADLDGDGVMDNTSSDSVGTGGASRRLAVHNIGSSGQDGVSVDLRCSPDSAAGSTELRRNGAVVCADYSRHTPFHNKRTSSFFDVFTEVSIEDVCDSAGASRRLKSHNLGSSGEDGVEVQLLARPSKGDVKITASQNSQSLRCSNSADSAAATMLVDADLDGDGLADRSVSSSADATSARVAIKTKGTGADPNRSMSASYSTTEMGSSSVCAGDLDGDGLDDIACASTVDDSTGQIGVTQSNIQVSMRGRKGWDGTIKGRIAIDENGAGERVRFDSDGDGYLSGELGIGVSAPVHAIDVAGGAYCDGTNWVNASDVNSKENFTAVDGNELLDQIAQLSITRWNYKGNDQADHIGPTAQDFKATFGVGADDKSISTIDPSGIALAAIKALNSKVQDLNAKTEEIAQLKAELDAIRAMLVKQAAAKN